VLPKIFHDWIISHEACVIFSLSAPMMDCFVDKTTYGRMSTVGLSLSRFTNTGDLVDYSLMLGLSNFIQAS
jgi:hypothetical protein